MSETNLALQEFKKICPPHDENNLDREWLEMFGFYWKGWQAKAAQQSRQQTGLTDAQFREFMKNYVIGIMAKSRKSPRKQRKP